MYYGLNLSLGGVGSYVGSALLADIIYAGTLLNVSATRYLKDIGSVPLDNATLYSGRAKQFATDMSMPIDIPYSLGSDIFLKLEDATGVVVTDNLDDTYTAVGTSGTRFTVYADSTIAVDDTVLWTFNASITSGSMTITEYYSDEAWVVLDTPHVITEGLNTFKSQGRDQEYLTLKMASDTFEIIFSSNLLKQITLDAKHLYKFDHDTDTFVYDELTDDQIQYHLGRVNGYNDGAYENKTYGLVNVFTDELSTADFDLMTSEPETLVNMVALDVADTRFTVTKGDCKVCMSLTEDGEYCRNYAEDLGANDVINSTFATDTDWSKGTTWTIAGGKATSNEGGNYLQQDSLPWVVGVVYLISFSIVDYTSGTIRIRPSTSNPLASEEFSGLGTYKHFVKFSSSSSDNFLNLIGTSFIGSIDNVTREIATASEILNYSTLPDPDIRTLSTGLQTTPFKLDSIGMIDGVGDGMEWHGEEYADTNFFGTTGQDFTIEAVIYLGNAQTGRASQDFGEEGIGNKSIYCRYTQDEYLYFKVGGANSYLGSYPRSQWVHILASHTDGSSSRYLNGEIKATTDTTFEQLDNPLLIGMTRDTTRPTVNPIRLFKIHKNKDLTQAEATKAYNDAVAKGYLS